jgi:RHS repeat-associated protein
MELTLVASSTLTITYGYDPLDRLTAADYSDGSFFHYAYDAAGNRLSDTTQAESNVYTYDDANRLASANGVAYTWDANGNLLSDGVYSYTYDGANRLTGVTDGVSAVSYAYNGLGDRLQTSAAGQTTRYTLDLVSGLTQVLDDGGYAYLYGNGRVAQYGVNGDEYFLGDALGSVRQLVDASGAVRLARSYQPYGELLANNGEGVSVYGFTGEATDASTGMIYLRARWYAPRDGMFTSKDVWRRNSYMPLSQNGWNYVEGNPVSRIDPSGKWYCQSGIIPWTTECRSWVKNALEELESSGTTGKRLVDFFHMRDAITLMLNDTLCRPLPMPLGIKIYFEPLVTGILSAQAVTIWPDQIHIKSGSSEYSNETPSTEAVITFGHEISHLAQGGFLPSLSVQAEALATIVGYYLERDLASNHRNDGLFIINNRLDPWSDADLMKYDEFYYDYFHKRLPYLIWGANGISRNWLENWSITLPYPISTDPKPKPDPIPTPPPPSPLSTPLPPGFFS